MSTPNPLDAGLDPQATAALDAQIRKKVGPLPGVPNAGPSPGLSKPVDKPVKQPPTADRIERIRTAEKNARAIGDVRAADRLSEMLKDAEGGGRRMTAAPEGRRMPSKYPTDYPAVPFLDRMMLPKLTNTQEVKNYFEMKYGKGSFTEDKQGGVVTIDGKKYRASAGFWGGVASAAPSVVGAMAGGTVGAAAGAPAGPPGALVGGMLGAGAGGAAVAGAEDIMKRARGISAQTPAE